MTNNEDLSKNMTTVRPKSVKSVKPKSVKPKSVKPKSVKPQVKADIDDFADFPVTTKPKNYLMKFLYFMFEIETPQDCLILFLTCLLGVGFIGLACIKETPKPITSEQWREWREMQEQIHGKKEKRDDYHDQ